MLKETTTDFNQNNRLSGLDLNHGYQERHLLILVFRLVTVPFAHLRDVKLMNCWKVIEKIEMGGTCGTYGGRERCAQGFGGET